MISTIRETPVDFFFFFADSPPFFEGFRRRSFCADQLFCFAPKFFLASTTVSKTEERELCVKKITMESSYKLNQDPLLVSVLQCHTIPPSILVFNFLSLLRFTAFITLGRGQKYDWVITWFCAVAWPGDSQSNLFSCLPPARDDFAFVRRFRPLAL